MALIAPSVDSPLPLPIRSREDTSFQLAAVDRTPRTTTALNTAATIEPKGRGYPDSIVAKRLIAGPPCAGKTTYVREHAAPGDRIVDYDDIIEDLTGGRYGPHPPEVKETARGIWVDALPGADWVIWAAPRRSERGRFRSQHNAEVFVIWTPPGVCLERARRHRPSSWQALIHQWFALWQPSRSGNETIVESA